MWKTSSKTTKLAVVTIGTIAVWLVLYAATDARAQIHLLRYLQLFCQRTARGIGLIGMRAETACNVLLERERMI